MSDAQSIPEPRADDDEDVHWALSTATALYARGEALEALKWLRRAVENASDANRDDRSLQLAKAAAELSVRLKGTAAPTPPPPPVMTPHPPAVTPSPPMTYRGPTPTGQGPSTPAPPAFRAHAEAHASPPPTSAAGRSTPPPPPRGRGGPVVTHAVSISDSHGPRTPAEAVEPMAPTVPGPHASGRATYGAASGASPRASAPPQSVAAVTAVSPQPRGGGDFRAQKTLASNLGAAGLSPPTGEGMRAAIERASAIVQVAPTAERARAATLPIKPEAIAARDGAASRAAAPAPAPATSTPVPPAAAAASTHAAAASPDPAPQQQQPATPRTPAAADRPSARASRRRGTLSGRRGGPAAYATSSPPTATPAPTTLPREEGTNGAGARFDDEITIERDLSSVRVAPIDLEESTSVLSGQEAFVEVVPAEGEGGARVEDEAAHRAGAEPTDPGAPPIVAATEGPKEAVAATVEPPAPAIDRRETTGSFVKHASSALGPRSSRSPALASSRASISDAALGLGLNAYRVAVATELVQGRIDAILLAAGEPAPAGRIAVLMVATEPAASAALAELSAKALASIEGRSQHKTRK